MLLNTRTALLRALLAVMALCIFLSSMQSANAQAAPEEKHADIKLAWEWPAELRGIFAKGMYGDCCFNGEETLERYYYIKLNQMVYIDDIVGPGEETRFDDMDTDEVQLGISIRNLPPGITPGMPIAIYCKALSEGMTAHYAVSTYCADPLITILPAGAKRAPSHIGPAFECSKAHSTSEKLICGDQHLAYLDAELSTLYAKAKDKTKNSDTFKQQTASEWKWRETNCADKACLANWYTHRKGQLEEFLR
jgi:uncharacterized protein YecT (DUF1311 family)